MHTLVLTEVFVGVVAFRDRMSSQINCHQEAQHDRYFRCLGREQLYAKKTGRMALEAKPPFPRGAGSA